MTRSLDRHIVLRHCKRLKIFEPATMVWGEQSRRAHLLDLSHGGALIDVSEPPEPHEEVRIECGLLRADARIIWRGGTRCGIEFLKPIDDAMIGHFVGTTSP